MATTDTTPMDVDALYQASQLPLPPDPVQAQQLWASLAADLAAAADEIRAGWGRAERSEAQLQRFANLIDAYWHAGGDDWWNVLEELRALADGGATAPPAEGRVAG